MRVLHGGFLNAPPRDNSALHAIIMLHCDYILARTSFFTKRERTWEVGVGVGVGGGGCRTPRYHAPECDKASRQRSTESLRRSVFNGVRSVFPVRARIKCLFFAEISCQSAEILRKREASYCTYV